MPRRLFTISLVLILALFAPWPGTAQIPSAPGDTVQMEFPVDGPKTLDTWARYFYGNQWKELQESVRSTLKTSDFDLPLLPAGAPQKKTHDFDFKKNYYRIVFVSMFAKSDGEIVQFLAHEDGLEPYANRLPGKDELFDVFVAVQGDAVLRTSYTSTRVANPLLDKLPSFIKQIDLGGLAKLVARAPEAVAPPSLFVQVSRVQLPLRRATIAISDEATIPPGRLGPDLVKASADREAALELREAGGSECARSVARCLDVALGLNIFNSLIPAEQDTLTRVDETLCAGGHHRQTLTDEEKADCAKKPEPSNTRCRLGKILRKTYDSAVSRGSACTAGTTAADFAAAAKVEDAYKSLLAGTPIKVKKDATYENVPREHVSLGVIAAAIISTSGDQRAKLDSGKLSANPISGTLSMAALNIHPISFDPKSATPTIGERFRLFVGACLTPEFGLGAGAGFSLVRGLSINAGYAWLRVDALHKGDSFGNPPANPKNPFRNGTREAFFVGFGYNF